MGNFELNKIYNESNLETMARMQDCFIDLTVTSPPYDVYIGRPSKWGNPFTHKQDGKTLAKHIVGSRDEAVQAYREWITNGDGKHLMNDLHELKNKVLGCWCHPQSCHGDVLSELVAKHCN